MTNESASVNRRHRKFYLKVTEPQAPQLTFIPVRKASPFISLARMRPRHVITITDSK